MRLCDGLAVRAGAQNVDARLRGVAVRGQRGVRLHHEYILIRVVFQQFIGVQPGFELRRSEERDRSQDCRKDDHGDGDDPPAEATVRLGRRSGGLSFGWASSCCALGSA